MLALDPSVLPAQSLHPGPGEPVGGLAEAEHLLEGVEVPDEDSVEPEHVHVHQTVPLVLLVQPPHGPHLVSARITVKLTQEGENVAAGFEKWLENLVIIVFEKYP